VHLNHTVWTSLVSAEICGLDDRGLILAGAGISVFATSAELAMGPTQPLIQGVWGGWDGVNLPEWDEVKHMWSCTSTSTFSWHDSYLRVVQCYWNCHYLSHKVKYWLCMVPVKCSVKLSEVKLSKVILIWSFLNFFLQTGSLWEKHFAVSLFTVIIELRSCCCML
jgi:hypothetical protein